MSETQVPNLQNVIDLLHRGEKLSQGLSEDLSRTEFAPDIREFLSRAMLMEAYPTPHLEKDNQVAFKRIVGEAMALAIRGHLQAAAKKKLLASAEKLLAAADKFLADRTVEKARMWYFIATTAFLLLLFGLFFLFDLYSKSAGTVDAFEQSSRYAVRLYLLAIVGGALGAGFSLLARIGKVRVDPVTGWSSVCGEVLFRLGIGALAALILLFGMEADVFAGFLKVSSENGLIDAVLYTRSFWIIGIFSILAGASERLVPSLLAQLSKSTIDKTGEELATDPSTPESKSTSTGTNDKAEEKAADESPTAESKSTSTGRNDKTREKAAKKA